MRVIRLILMLLAASLLLCGCENAGEAENHAYALVLGVDRTEEGIGLTIQIPRIGRTQDQGERGSAGSEPYMTLSASGSDYAQAMEQLQWTAARELNLSQLKLIVVSESLASDDAFPPLIRAIAETRHLYTTAGFIVCEGAARPFVEGLETILGTRLSSEINAMFRHYAAHGVIPKSTFADLYDSTLSPYSDPTGILGFTSGGTRGPEELQPKSVVVPRAVSSEGGADRRYLGTAVFREGRLVCRLDAADTLLMNLISGRVDAFTCAVEGRMYSLSSASRARQSVKIDGGRVRMEVKLRLTSEAHIPPEDLDALRSALAEDLRRVIAQCQGLRVEPFGFASHAAMRFPTLEAWEAFDWRSRFSTAEVRVDISLSNPVA